MGKKILVDVTVLIRHETDSAYLVTDGKTEIKKDSTGPSEIKTWLPKSQIEIEIIGNRSAIVTMPEWLAKEKGFI